MEKKSFIACFTVLFLIVDGKENIRFLTIDFRLRFVVVEVKVRLSWKMKFYCSFYNFVLGS